MHHHPRRVRRAIRLLAFGGLAAGAATPLVATGVASAAPLTEPTVTVKEDGTLIVTGTEGADTIRLFSPALHPGIVSIDLDDDGQADSGFDVPSITAIVVRARGGDDTVTVDETAGVSVPVTDRIPSTFDGGDGSDLLVGGSGAEQFVGGAGDDVVDGNRGNDDASLDRGQDEFIWDPGDGSDTVAGGGDFDVMTFNGNGAAETFAATANGNKLRFARDLGNIVMDTKGLEQVDVRALGGADRVRVDDLARTDVSGVDIDLGASLSAPGSDGAVDTVVVNGSTKVDSITISGTLGGVGIDGLDPRVTVSDADPADVLDVHALAGADRIDAALLALDTMRLQADGGDGDDVLLGGVGDDLLLGGAGHDVVDGNRGADVGLLGDGDDEFIWDPGDGSDVVEGQSGDDVMSFRGNAAAEQFAAAPNGGRIRFTRDLGNIVMDTDDVERIQLDALGGTDGLTVGDVSGTDLTAVTADLGLTLGAAGGDAAVDTLRLGGTAGVDNAVVSGGSGNVAVAGLSAAVTIVDADATDVLAFDGVEQVDAGGLAAGAITLG